MSEHLTVLNLDVSSLTAESVRRAYRTESLKWHPDKPHGNAARFRQVRAAYEFLRDPLNLRDIIEAARSRHRYATTRQRVTQEMTREVLKKERMAERLKAKEREAARRQEEVSQASQKIYEKFQAKSRCERPHQYPSNYILSSSDDESSSTSERTEISRLTAMRSSAASRHSAVKTKLVVTRVHAQHLVVDISEDSSDTESCVGG